MNTGSILIALHFGSNIGYAISPLEKAFYNMARELVGGDDSRIHFSYQDLEKGMPESLPAEFGNVIALQTKDASASDMNIIDNYIRTHNITVVFGFDFPVKLPIYKVMRKAGVRKIVSYYGAPLSSINSGLKLLLKRLDVAVYKYKPDHFILESDAMRQTAVNGRGIRKSNTSMVHLGVDTDKFKPNSSLRSYAYDAFKIPSDRKIIFYSGHMQKRKGVDVIIDAITYLVNVEKRNDLHVLLLGNKGGDEKRFFPVFEGTEAEDHITFGGYRDDLNKLMASCYLGVIASNGWDSFPRSAIEIGASGLPLLVSNFQGLVETINNGTTGRTFTTNDPNDLASHIKFFLENEDQQRSYSKASRERAVKEFTLNVQHNNLVTVMRSVVEAEVN